jgi:membrane protein YqaA with SNARE-associated domain
MRQAASRHAPWALAAVSFAEASFFPIPPDVMLVPMAAARPDKAWRYAAICTLASILGGCAGYAIGYFLQDLGQQLLTFFGHPDAMAEFKDVFDQWGAWFILIKGLTPIPFKLVTIASGLAGFNFGIFLLAVTITRAGRFFLEAALLKKFGPTVMPIVEKRLNTVALLVVAFIVGGFLLLKFV